MPAQATIHFLLKNHAKQASEAGTLKVSPDGGSEPTDAGGRINFGKTAFTAVFWQTGGLRGF